MILILNDVAGTEIILILVFVLIFFGSKSIPGIARTLGKTIRQVKDASADIQNEIKKSGANMKKDLNLDGLVNDTAQELRRPLDQYVEELDNAVKFSPKKSHIQNASVPEKTSEKKMESNGEDQGEKPEEEAS